MCRAIAWLPLFLSAYPGVPPAAAAPIAPSGEMSSNIVLNNMFSASEVNLESDPTFFEDVMEDVKQECSSHGTVARVWLSRINIDGKVWVKMQDVQQAVKVAQALNGRYFAGTSARGGGRRCAVVVDVAYWCGVVWCR